MYPMPMVMARCTTDDIPLAVGEAATTLWDKLKTLRRESGDEKVARYVSRMVMERKVWMTESQFLAIQLWKWKDPTTLCLAEWFS